MNKLPEFDVYGELGVSKTTPRPEIARAHRRLARIYHPDAPDPSVLEELEGDPGRYNRIEQAWEVLGDDEMRRMYDEREAERSRRVVVQVSGPVIKAGPLFRFLVIYLSRTASWGENWMTLWGLIFEDRGHKGWQNDYPAVVRIGRGLDWIQNHSVARYAFLTVVVLIFSYMVVSVLFPGPW